MEGDSCMCERILRKIESILHDDTELKEFCIIPTEGNITNKSPVIYEELSIGLESWCIKHVYKYAYMELFNYRNSSSRKKQIILREGNLNRLLIGALLINPNVVSFWNMKREMVKSEMLSIEEELVFSKIVLSHKSKSNETFVYRRWLLQRLFAKIFDTNNEQFRTLITNELKICEVAAGKSPNNYHSWTHRMWLLNNIRTMPGVIPIFHNEVQFSYSWLSQHVSEHSCYHYRQFVINTVSKISMSLDGLYLNHLFSIFSVNDANKLQKVLFGKVKEFNSNEELECFVNSLAMLIFDLKITIENLIRTYKDHESIWYHRRYLINQLIQIIYDYYEIPQSNNNNNNNLINSAQKTFSGDSTMVDAIIMDNDGLKEAKMLKSQPNKVKKSYLYKFLCNTEMDFIKRACGRFDVEFGKRHAKWLKFIVGMEQG